MTGWINRFEKYSKPLLMALSIGLVGVIGLVDWVTGFELSFFLFYLMPVALAVWYVGLRFGIVVSVLSVGVWVVGDMTAGARYSGPFVPVWNALIAVVFLLVVAGMLTRLRKFHRELEARVRERTVALTNEIHERSRLERELLGISEREQLRIGHDLHDSLCQHLTGTALAGQVLGEKLTEKSLPEAEAANHVVRLVEEAIDLSRALARGLHPMDLEGEGFVQGFRELASGISERFKISCKLECSSSFEIAAPTGAIHLYRIAQESITNAIKHGKATEIVIHLESNNEGIMLIIEDDGSGLPENASQGQGMGLRIMEYRAGVIGGEFRIERLNIRGTRVVCTLPIAKAPKANNYAAQKQDTISG